MGFREMFASNDPAGRGSILVRVESEPHHWPIGPVLFSERKRTLPLVFAELLGHGRSEELLDPPAPPQCDQQIQQLREAARRKRAGVMAATEALGVLW